MLHTRNDQKILQQKLLLVLSNMYNICNRFDYQNYLLILVPSIIICFKKEIKKSKIIKKTR